MPRKSVSSTRQTTSGDCIDRWLSFVVAHRAAVLAATIVMLVLATVAASDLHKDATADAYIEPGNPALLYRERVVDTFGLKEPIIIAVRNLSPDGILTVDNLALVRSLVKKLETTPNIDTDRITSLVSQSAITSGIDGLEVDRLLPDGDIDATTIATLRATLYDTPLYDGTLVSKGRTATIIAAELLDESQADATYREVLRLTAALDKPAGTEIFVAGAGAITGYFASYIDRDAGRLVPFAAIAVSVVLFCAFLTVRSALLPMSIAVATIVVTLGVMAACDVPFYAITNGMVVVLIGIAVAEPMHVFGEYYTLMRDRPGATNAELVIGAMQSVWRPIALTSITTVGGFFSLWVTSTMPPIRYFGLFGAFGIVVAWVLTVSFLPALMSMLPRRQSRLIEREQAIASDPISRAVMLVGTFVIRHPRGILVASAVISALALLAASRVTVDHARIENFNASEAIYIADREINLAMAGTNQLDIVIEADTAEGVLTPEALRHMDALQAYLLSLPQVGGSISIANYLKQLHRAVSDGDAASFRVPDDPALIAQLMLTYQASAPPTEFQALIDSTGRTALIRTYLRADRWSEQRKVVQAAQQFVNREFAGASVRATLTGRVMLDYKWVQSVASGHALSVIVSTLTVLLMCIVVFRSIRDGLLCLLPLFVSVALVYAAMGIGNIWLGVATSMFASVAIGLGIDFAIHMVARARKAAERALDTNAAMLYVYRSTGRAVVFNAAAVGLGFGIVTLSAAPPIRMFGVLVATAVAGAFIAALTVLPATLKLLSDAAVKQTQHASTDTARTIASALLVTVLLGGLHASIARADGHSDPTAEHLMSTVAKRPEGDSADRVVRISLIDRNGAIREQTARAVRKNVSDGRRMAIFYQAPANIRGTSFLVFDYSDDARANDQWLYLPALRKVRRIPAADRGDYFLGTDLTFDEIRNDNRVTLADWTFSVIGNDEVDGIKCALIEGVAASDQIAKELGYGRARWCIDPAIRMGRRTEYWDRTGNLLKTVFNRDVTLIDGIWSALRVEVKNHKTGHSTKLEFAETKFDAALPDSMFTQQQMERGL